MSNMEHIQFNYDKTSNTFYQNVKGYHFCIMSTGNNQKVLIVSVSKDGKQPDSSLIKADFKKIKSISNVTSQGYRLIFHLKSALSKKKTDANVQDGLNYIVDYLNENNYQNCCEICGNTTDTGIYCVSGIARILCSQDYTKATEELVYRKQKEDIKKENVFTGTIGALLGSLIGTLAIVFFGQIGYVVTVAGIIMGVCVIKGYELLGNKLSKRGIVICIIVVILMTYFANRVDWSVTIARELELGFIDSFVNCDYIVEYFDIKSSYYADLGLKYLFTLVGAIPLIIASFKDRQIKNESYIISAADNTQIDTTVNTVQDSINEANEELIDEIDENQVEE